MSPTSPDQTELTAGGHSTAIVPDANFNEPPAPQPTCGNCGATLQGAYCHQCGQAAKTPVRHLSDLGQDVLDTVFNFDGRVIHTLPALYARPGYLSREYFAGRRARYIAPFRLMFMLCLLAFFVTRLEVNYSTNKIIVVDRASSAQVPAQLDQQVGKWRKQATVDAVPASTGSAAMPATAASSADDAPLPGLVSSSARFDPRGHPLKIDGMPHFINQALNDVAIRVYANVMAAAGREGAVARKQARERIISQTFAVLPQTLLVLLPLFALLLKAFYLFKRRLYVEHLIVALHSHAFLFLSLLLLSLLGMAGHQLGNHGTLNAMLGGAAAVMTWWVPVYLLVAQKRIYGQGWPMTLVKFGFIGVSYLILVSLGLIVATVIGFTAG